jgi:hypothetical protein
MRIFTAALAVLALASFADAGGYGAPRQFVPRAPVYAAPPVLQQQQFYAPPGQDVVREKFVQRTVVRQRQVYAPPVLQQQFAAPAYDACVPQQAFAAPAYGYGGGVQFSARRGAFGRRSFNFRAGS